MDGAAQQQPAAVPSLFMPDRPTPEADAAAGLMMGAAGGEMAATMPDLASQVQLRAMMQAAQSVGMDPTMALAAMHMLPGLQEAPINPGQVPLAVAGGAADAARDQSSRPAACARDAAADDAADPGDAGPAPRSRCSR